MTELLAHPRCERCHKRPAMRGSLCWECYERVVCPVCHKPHKQARDGITEDEGTCTPMYDAAFRWLEDGSDDAE